MDEYLEQLKTKKLVEVFVTRFEELILSGKLAVGQKLPSERDLAAKLGVSRPVVHEGLLDLATKGLIARLPRGGAMVNDYRKEGSLAILTTLLNFNEGVLDLHLAKSLVEMRALFETEIAGLAARNRTPEQLEAFWAIVREEGELKANETARIIELDFSFHHSLAMASANAIYPLLINSFHALYTNYTALFFSNPEVVPQVFAFHKDLVAAISDQDEAPAKQIMTRMLEHGASHYWAIVSQK